MLQKPGLIPGLFLFVLNNSMAEKTNYHQQSFTKDNLKNPQKYCGRIAQIVTRSSWENSFIRYLDEATGVLEWSSEEIAIIYTGSDGRQHRYFPDFYMRYRNKNGVECEAIIEIKPYRETIRPKLRENVSRKTADYLLSTWDKNQRKWAAAKQFCFNERQYKMRNINFFIITERDLELIPKHHLDENLKRDGFII